MPSALRVGLSRIVVLIALAAPLAAHAAATPRALAAAESLYGDWLDARFAIATIDSGLMPAVDGHDLAWWTRRYGSVQSTLHRRLDRLAGLKLDAVDARALALMVSDIASQSPGDAESMRPNAHCADARDPEATQDALSGSLYGCFEEIGSRLQFEGRTVVRLTAMQLLEDLDEPARRASVFAALAPLFAAINGDDGTGSPYRRLLGMVATSDQRSRIAEAADTLAISVDEAERWLVAVLEAWRDANPGAPIEPADYWHHYAAGAHGVSAHVPADIIPAVSARYYRDLGADLVALHVLHDLGVRPGKAPISYEDTVRIGRQTGHGWRPAVARVSSNLESGGLSMLNELIHEDGHAIHDSAIRTRPAFFSAADLLFTEAFADVPSWSTAEPTFQAKYLGVSAPLAASLRDHYSRVVLDVCWGLFELRMLRAPGSDPNLVWTDITSRYLRIAPHPEWSWWALRAQLVHEPGYMIYYALGAILTADMRARVRAEIGPFDTGNPAWYGYVSTHVLRYGGEIEAPRLLREFLGRPVSPSALLVELARIPAARD
jgi:hypothetical protein